ncbi:NFATC2IP [Branchiostoma lanceolatum]|uniref:NFATC2-interacting protein n=1 Tax=Branchiostoma lanceolatum TaxID=7740 RepID=A0A8J9V9L8_BRALA|nr:NFATC2IP [Branchiostoma lanceolatum]
MADSDCAEFSSSAQESVKNGQKSSAFRQDSSSSDSDEEERIVITKKPPPRRRKFNMNASGAKTGNIYMGRVKDLFSVNMATLSHKHDSDEENNGGNVVFPPSKSKVRKTSPETANPVSSRTEEPSALVISSDEEELSADFRSPEDRRHVPREQSLSPPPPPPMSFDSLLNDVGRLRATKARKGTEKILRGVDAALKVVRRTDEPAGLSSPSTISLDCSGLASPSTPVDREITVKVRSRSSGAGVHRINMRMSEKFEKIFRSMSEREGAPIDRVLLVLRDYTIQQADTPQSIGLHIADIIDCSISNASMAVEEEEVASTEGKHELKIQGKERRTEKTFSVDKSEELLRIMQEYAAFRELPLNRLVFKFDGDVISPNDTPEDLDMEGGETIDARALQ